MPFSTVNVSPVYGINDSPLSLEGTLESLVRETTPPYLPSPSLSLLILPLHSPSNRNAVSSSTLTATFSLLAPKRQNLFPSGAVSGTSLRLYRTALHAGVNYN